MAVVIGQLTYLWDDEQSISIGLDTEPGPAFNSFQIFFESDVSGDFVSAGPGHYAAVLQRVLHRAQPVTHLDTIVELSVEQSN